MMDIATTSLGPAAAGPATWEELPDMVTTDMLAAFMHVHAKTLRDMYTDGRLPHPTIRGRKNLWQKKKLRDWLDQRDRMTR